MAGPSKKMIFGKIFGLITTTSKDLTTITGGGHDDNLVTIMIGGGLNDPKLPKTKKS